jgi:hypothetical protein
MFLSVNGDVLGFDVVKMLMLASRPFDVWS